ncbi:MAG: M48 family metalloprotease [Chloroflexi bacterium]|nr:M48 family metalloprotease [Chloroflexota bacterium]
MSTHAGESIFERLYLGVSERLGKNLFEQVVNAKSLEPTWTLARTLAFLIAGLVHSLTFGIGLLGIFLVVRFWFNLFAILGAVACFATVWFLMPRLPRLSDPIVPRAEIPTVYQTVDRVAQALGAARVDGIVIDENFNAAVAQVGLRRKRILFIGLPLFATLDAQEKVAVLGHELAHNVNGDPMRSFFEASAVGVLVEWHRMLQPQEMWQAPGGLVGLVLLIALPLARLFTYVISFIPWLGAYALAHLLWRHSQRAEYLADHLAATVSGTNAMIALLNKLGLVDKFLQTLHTITLNRKDRDLFGEYRQVIAGVNADHLAPSSEESAQTRRADSSHPPTAYRIAFLNARRVAGAQVVLSSFDADQMDRELKPFEKAVQAKLMDRYEGSLYY